MYYLNVFCKCILLAIIIVGNVLGGGSDYGLDGPRNATDRWERPAAR